MKTFDKVKDRHGTCLKIGDTFFTTLTNVLCQMKASMFYKERKPTFTLLSYFYICYRCQNLIYFNNQFCLTKKH